MVAKIYSEQWLAIFQTIHCLISLHISPEKPQLFYLFLKAQSAWTVQWCCILQPLNFSSTYQINITASSISQNILTGSVTMCCINIALSNVCCTIKWTFFRFCKSIKDYPVYLLLHYQVNLLQILWQHQRLSCLFIFVWEINSEANKLILQFLRGPLVEMHTRGWGSGGQIFGWF